MLIITASHQTFSGQFWCLSSQNIFDLTHLLYIINGKVSVFLEDKVMSRQISTLIISTVVTTVLVTARLLFTVAPPEILEHPVSSDVPIKGSTILTCQASSLGTLVYSWEKSSGSSWTTISNSNTASYTTDTTLAIGQYMYRCRVSNDAGSVLSNIATVNVCGEYCPNM